MPRSPKVEAVRDLALFRTANLNLAAYLVASNRLALDHVEPHPKYSEFFFLDSSSLGPTIAAEFATRNLKVSAKLLLEARSSLLNEIRRGDNHAR